MNSLLGDLSPWPAEEARAVEGLLRDLAWTELRDLAGAVPPYYHVRLLSMILDVLMEDDRVPVEALVEAFQRAGHALQ